MARQLLRQLVVVFIGLTTCIVSLYAEELTVISQWQTDASSLERKQLQSSEDGRVLVQDFYSSGEKFSEPFWLQKNEVPRKSEYFGVEELNATIVAQMPLITWYKNGRKRFVVEWLTQSSNANEVSFTLWYENGRSYKKTIYDKNFNKRYQATWYETGQLQSENYFQAYAYEGAQRAWYKNGRLKRVSIYQQQKLNGYQEKWYSSGQLQERIFYKDGLLDGAYSRWYKNGQLQYKADYQQGRLDGELREWNESGQLLKSAIYKNNKLIGAYKEWYPSGQIFKDNYYEPHLVYIGMFDKAGNKLVDVKQVDEAIYFAPTFVRRLLKETAKGYLVQDFFQNGTKRSDPYWLTDKSDVTNHKLLPESCYGCFSYLTEVKPLSLKGAYIQYYITGHKELEMSYNNGLKDGVYILWGESDLKRLEISYKEGVYDGASRMWINGIQLNEANYKQGRLDGLSRAWYENGQLAEETYYKNGKRDGISKRWHRNGQKFSVINYKKGLLDSSSQVWRNRGVQLGLAVDL